MFMLCNRKVAITSLHTRGKGTHVYMNNHLYRTPQCTKERIRKKKRKKEDTH